MKFIIDNSTSRIEGLSLEDYRKLRNVLCYQVDSASYHFSGSFGPKTKPLISKDGTFPTGILYLAMEWFKENNKTYTVNDNRKRPKAQEDVFKASLCFNPYPEQIEAAEACKRFKRGIVKAPTGTGKSVIIALIIEQCQVPTLVVVPTVELENQLTEEMKRIFGEDKVGEGKLIYVENISGLANKQLKRQYDCLIIDEYHHSAATTYRKLNKTQWAGIYYRFGCTATPFRAKEEERLLLESVLSQVIYSISYDTAVSKSYIVPMEAYYIEIPKQKNNSRTWPSMYSTLVVNNDTRNKIIVDLLLSLKTENKSTLCLVKEIAHGNVLSKNSSIFFANGQDGLSNELIGYFKSNNLKSLIGTTGVLGEGVDTKPCEYVIIAGLGKSRNNFHQQIGRGFRKYQGKESCKVILFLDRSHKWSIEHFKAQCKYLREDFGVEPVKLTVE